MWKEYLMVRNQISIFFLRVTEMRDSDVVKEIERMSNNLKETNMNDLKFTTAGSYMEDDLVYRLRKRAEIRRQIANRKSVQEGKPDRISDLLEEAANEIERLNNIKAGIDRNTDNKEYSIGTEEGYNDFIKYRNRL